ncbi:MULTISPECIES: sensor histidine kinase [unclassified Duganella]|uniref:sensor histidine kinase n=1 Tax=unclassified Duganella TaxID=2636909 RepID=UPI001314350A|nr:MULTISPECIES: histidine kinase [unclassified Duganella]
MMMSTTKPSFLVRPQVVEHDRSLMRRYLWQSILRPAASMAIVLALLCMLFMAAAYSAGPVMGHWPRWGWSVLIACYPLFLGGMVGLGSVRRTLAELREAGTPLSEAMISSRPCVLLVSPLDPLSTIDLCAETLSGLAIGVALGYHRPPVFARNMFQGKIWLGPWRPLWSGRSIEVAIVGEPGEAIQVRIRRRFGLDFFWAQDGSALRAVEAVAAHLRTQLEQRDHALKAARRERELERVALNAKLSALQAQVEPHFLFNTLANLKYLIRTDAGAAQQMLDYLVGYLQNALPDMRSVSSTLERELELARNYLSIMQVRMGHRLRFRIDAAPELLALPFPPAMLISLVENAVKHGLERASRPGEIAIVATSNGARLRVLVSDDGTGLADQMGQGFGLANIHERLQLLYGDAASLAVTAAQSGGVDAALSVPLPAGKE